MNKLAKKYKHLRIAESVYKQLRMVKNLYELQDDEEYNWDEVFLKLVDDRASKQFKLPLNVPEAKG